MFRTEEKHASVCRRGWEKGFYRLEGLSLDNRSVLCVQCDGASVLFKC